jgi:hypothetical protein
LGKPCTITPEEDIKVKKVNIEQPIIIIPIPSPTCNEKWSYLNHGSDWECSCKEGKIQSPINIPKINEVVKTDNRALFKFQPLEGDDLKILLQDYKLTINVITTFLH